MIKINRPLVKKLEAFVEAKPVSFHVPGHKNGLLSELPKGLRSALQYDLTELSGLDDLHEASGVIAEAEQALQELYGANRSFFLINGSTVGNLAMIYATCRAGETVIVQRNAHKSVFHAIELTGAKPVFIAPEWDEHTRSVGAVSVNQIQRALDSYPNAKAVILTYPSYYGSAGDELREIIRVCHLEKVPVLVDEAHGAHFVIGVPFPRSALELGADIVVHSAHKTLPAMTMASFLHVRSSLVSNEVVARYLSMLQSSSPSYLLMASLDDARAYAASFDDEDKLCFSAWRHGVIERLRAIDGLETITVDDPLKLILRVEGYSGFQVQAAFEQEGIYVELADLYQVLLVLPLLKSMHCYSFDKIASKIEVAITSLGREKMGVSLIDLPNLREDITELAFSMSEIDTFRISWIRYEKAVGCVMADAVIPYPPGIPLLVKGERVTEEHLVLLANLLMQGANFQGAICVEKKLICVVINGVEE